MAKYQAMTQEWLDAWKQKIVESKEYKEIAKNWEGSVSIIVNPDPERGIPSRSTCSRITGTATSGIF